MVSSSKEKLSKVLTVQACSIFRRPFDNDRTTRSHLVWLVRVKRLAGIGPMSLPSWAHGHVEGEGESTLVALEKIARS